PEGHRFKSCPRNQIKNGPHRAGRFAFGARRAIFDSLQGGEADVAGQRKSNPVPATSFDIKPKQFLALALR
ncbi:hypothetical protein, partial [Mesorhizobium sp.]|uniref:hypothetical protein n=1 Tax=Mesorhizobium sp. TaxID=1871066 RepID=UPI0025BD5847